MRPIRCVTVILAAACSLPGCYDPGVDVPPAAPSEPPTAESCATVDWLVIGPFDLLQVGSSQVYTLFPGKPPAAILGCEAFISSAEWSVADPGIASLETLPEVHRITATGVANGSTELSVRFTLQGGQIRTVDRPLLVVGQPM